MSDEKAESPAEVQHNHRKDLYKYSERDLAYTQEERRRQFLAAQKEKRSAAFDEKRDISELLSTEENCDEVIKKRWRRKCPFEHRFMRAEWLVFPPEDLSENWLVKPCPEGIRVLVIANKGITKCYIGNKIFRTFRSTLPGGNNQEYRNKFTILDCIYHRTSKTFLVFDMLAWNSVSLLDAECALRFIWLKSHFEENLDLSHSKCKRYSFVVIDPLSTEPSLIQETMSSPYVIAEHALCYEGVLFYHREGHYAFGQTPLVLWLKSFMLPEILNIDVDQCHLLKKPRNYENILEFLKARESRLKMRRNGRRSSQTGDNNMDTETGQPKDEICDIMESSEETEDSVVEEMRNLEQENAEDLDEENIEELEEGNIEGLEQENIEDCGK